jgi:hypothetical protein
MYATFRGVFGIWRRFGFGPQVTCIIWVAAVLDPDDVVELHI